MKITSRQLNILLASVILMLSFSFNVFAEGVKYSNELTVTPVRVFFAILIIPAFIVMEIAFEKIREKRVEKRNKKLQKESKGEWKWFLN